ncbi:RNA-directed DNA polymerase, eukaryota, reverse transcriptase zinc-binding domain protein [Tanacetum coccineum]
MWIVVYAPQNLSKAGEIFGSIFNERQANIFNEFITNASLIDTSLGGFNFNWTDKWGSKMSKLDQFLVSESFCEIFPHVIGVVLEKGEIGRLETKDIAQKTKIKWAIKGDENTSFFHDMLKKKRRQLAIKGILKNGEWIKDPEYVKAKFMEHFRNHFQRRIVIPHSLDADSLNRLASSQSEFLEQHFSQEEIKRAMWDCGGDHALGPDGCLSSTRSSVLVNGSPIAAFEIFRGLRKGDPLSSFLFILDMEGLHALTCKAEQLENGPGNVLGVCVSDEEFFDMANIIGFGAAKFPLKYLEVLVRCGMVKCSNWNAIIYKFTSKLSLWKARLLSVGVRLTLIKSVLENLPTYYMLIYMMSVLVQKKLEPLRNKLFIGGDQDDKKMTWVRWKNCLASKKLGGRSIGSIFGLNIGLILKCIWRLLCQPSNSWARVIKNIYGLHRGINNDFAYNSNQSTCGAILSLVKHLKHKACSIANQLSLLVLCSVLRRPLRGGAELAQLIALRDFIVALVRSLVDDHTLDVDTYASRWNRYIPININVFSWRLMLNKLPSRVNLDKKVNDIGSVLCPIYQEDVETLNHTFFSYEMTKYLWALLARWWDLDIPVCANILEWFEWFASLCVSNMARSVLKGVGGPFCGLFGVFVIAWCGNHRGGEYVSI